MTSQKHVVLSTNNIAGAGGVLITDITVDAETVVLTAEHGGQLKLPLKNCVGRLFASVMGDMVMLNYVQQSFDMPLVPQPVPGFGHHHCGVSAPVGGSIFGISVETMVESQVSALFQSPLTTRLIEPLREAAREITDPHPGTFTPFNADAKTAAVERSGTASLTFNGEKVTWIDIEYPTTKIITGRSEVKVDTARLSVSTHHTNSEIKL
uniref:hypothetical protein n=1 Tax=Companilactobacillus sp. TaxID=2767905 RepID=UPI00260B595E